MGLDIYHFKILKPSKKEYSLIEYEKLIENFCDNWHDIFIKFKNNYCEQLFKQYKDYVAIGKVSLIDFEKTFKVLGYSFRDLEWYCSSTSLDDEIEKQAKKFISKNPSFYHIFKDKNGNFIVIDENYEKIITEEKYEEFLLVKELNYQRKNMKEEFYEKYTNCWYEKSNEQLDDYTALMIVKDNKQLEEIKEYATKDALIKNWRLKENEFIYFSY